MKILNSNNEYYNSRNEYEYYNFVMYQGVSTVILNFESIGLKENVQNKIVNVRWTFSCYNDYGYASDYYKNETSGQTTWDCKIAIMNLSDYGYVANLKSCTSKLLNMK